MRIYYIIYFASYNYSNIFWFSINTIIFRQYEKRWTNVNTFWKCIVEINDTYGYNNQYLHVICNSHLVHISKEIVNFKMIKLFYISFHEYNLISLNFTWIMMANYNKLFLVETIKIKFESISGKWSMKKKITKIDQRSTRDSQQKEYGRNLIWWICADWHPIPIIKRYINHIQNI